MKKFVVVACLIVLLAPVTVFGSGVLLSNAPAYDWYHGCTPTAVGSIMGYWDLHGYSNMFSASGWAAVSQTVNVQDQISSPAHNAKYDSTPDRASLLDPPKTSIADFLKTSVGSAGFGGTQISNIASGMTGYAGYRGYSSLAQEFLYAGGASGLTWSKFTSEINAGRPMLFDVDSDGNGVADHSVPVFGYEDRGAAGKYFGCYTTWSESETIQWFPFRGVSSNYSFGIYDADSFAVTSTPSTVSPVKVSSVIYYGNYSGGGYGYEVPEPSSLVFLGTGLAIAFAGFLVRVIRRKK